MAVSPLYQPEIEPEEDDKIIDISDRFTEPKAEQPNDNIIDIRDQLARRKQLPTSDTTLPGPKGLDDTTLQNINSTENKLKGKKDQVEQKAKDEIKEVAKKETSQVIRAASKAAVEGIGEFLVATSEIWVPVLVVIIGLIALVFALYGIYHLLGNSGAGAAQLPTTQEQKDQATLLAAYGGDSFSQSSVTQKTIDSERARYKIILAQAQAYPGNASISAITTVQTTIDQLDQANQAHNQKKVLSLLPTVISQEQSIENTLPWGEWIARFAEKSAGQGTVGFCLVTHAAANVGCASVVSTILNQVGARQIPVAATLDVWNNPRLKLIVAPLANHALSRDTLSANRASLQRGDIVWWGNGVSKGRLVYSGALFNHVGIYVGPSSSVCTGGKDAVANSSRQEEVGCTSLARTDMIFNGAKRYAP